MTGTSVATRGGPGAAARPGTGPGLLHGTSSCSLGLVLLLVLVGLATVASIAIGAKSIPVGTVADALTSFDPANDDHLIVRELRIPRTILALCVDRALGLAGAVMQGVTRNPLADPGLLGVNAGAALAVVASIYVLGVGSVIGDGVVRARRRRRGRRLGVRPRVGGAGRGHPGQPRHRRCRPVRADGVGDGRAAPPRLGHPRPVPLLGRRLGRRPRHRGRHALAPSSSWAPLALASSRALDSLALGEDVARGLGQRVGLVRAPGRGGRLPLRRGHRRRRADLVRRPGGAPRRPQPHRPRPPLAPALLHAPRRGPPGAADTIGRMVVRPGELEVGVVTAFLGAPVFIAFVRRRRIAEL